MGYVRLQEAPFDLDAVAAEGVTASTGAVTLYVGTVRGQDDGARVEALEIEAYGEMALQRLESIRRQTMEAHGLEDAIVIHRTGRVAAGDPILVAAFFAPHRRETFAAAEDFMDRLKRDVPIWKREEGERPGRWVGGQSVHEAVP